MTRTDRLILWTPRPPSERRLPPRSSTEQLSNDQLNSGRRSVVGAVGRSSQLLLSCLFVVGRARSLRPWSRLKEWLGFGPLFTEQPPVVESSRRPVTRGVGRCTQVVTAAPRIGRHGRRVHRRGRRREKNPCTDTTGDARTDTARRERAVSTRTDRHG